VDTLAPESEDSRSGEVYVRSSITMWHYKLQDVRWSEPELSGGLDSAIIYV